MKSAVPVLLGAWLGALLASWVAATVNFRTVDRVLGAERRPELGPAPAPLAHDAQRQVLRHLASEINRWSFRWWSRAQLALGLLLVVLCWRTPGPARLVLAAALLLVAAQVLLVRPIVDLGRALDFLPRPLPPPLARRFGLLHAAYVGSDLAKAALLAVASWLAGRR